MNVDGKDFADFGNGLAPATADQGTREESDPLALSALYGAFLGQSNDFVLAGKETVHGVPSDHLVLDPDELAKVRDQFGDGNEAWVAELWLAEADGRLVKAVWGWPPGGGTRIVRAALLHDRRDRHELHLPGDRAGLRRPR